MFCQKLSEASAQTRTCRTIPSIRRAVCRQASLIDSSSRPRALRLQVEARRSGRSQATDQGHLRDARVLWLSPRSRAAVSRWLGRQRQTGLSPPSRLRPAITQQNAKTSDQSQAANGGARQVNETWAMDFVHDQLATGRKLRVLTIVDTFSRFSPAIDARFSYRGESCKLWSGSAGSSSIPRASVLTRARSSSRAIARQADRQ